MDLPTWQPEPGWQPLPGAGPATAGIWSATSGGREVVVKRLRRPDPHDAPGALVEDWQDEVEELSPVAATLDGKGEGRLVPVHLHSKVTEVGQLEVWCISRDGKQRWKLEYNVRERDH